MTNINRSTSLEMEVFPKKCERDGCTKGYSKFCPFSEPTKAKPGNHEGKGKTLRTKMWGTNGYKSHPWWTGNGALEAHHLICSEVMQSWEVLCNKFGYDVNNKYNGVMLPYTMELACHLGVPMHRSNHSNTNPAYPIVVGNLVEPIQNNINKGTYCGQDGWEKFNNDLNTISKRIMRKVSAFAYKLTADGKDYEPASSMGCGNLSNMGEKYTDCSKQRNHEGEFKHEKTSTVIKSYKTSGKWKLKVNDGHVR